MKTLVLTAIAIGLMAGALLFLGFCMYQLTLPDVVTMEMKPVTVTEIRETVRHSQEGWIWVTLGAVVLTGVAAVVAAIIAGEIE